MTTMQMCIGLHSAAKIKSTPFFLWSGNISVTLPTKIIFILDLSDDCFHYQSNAESIKKTQKAMKHVSQSPELMS